MRHASKMQDRIPAWLAFGVIVLIVALAGSPVLAALPTARLKHALAVGGAKNIRLDTGQVVQVLKNSGDSVVILVQLPGGSSGIYQIDAAAVEMLAAGAPTAVASPPPIVPTPANTGTVPSVTAVIPARNSQSPPVSSLPPSYPEGFVGGPEFDTTAGRQAAGTASVIKLKDGTQSYVVSARHLLGPMGGFATQTAARDVPAFVGHIRIGCFSGGVRRYSVTGLLVPTERLKADGGAPIDDMAVYQIHDTAPQSQAVVLAEQVPAIGDHAWVVARVRGGVPEGQIMQGGVVTGNSDWIIIRFDNDGIITAGASGVPVLNAAGEVIGVYSGHGKKDGHVFGFIIPAPLISKIIKQAPSA